MCARAIGHDDIALLFSFSSVLVSGIPGNKYTIKLIHRLGLFGKMILRKETQGTHNQTHLLVLAYVHD